ncbi:MAG: AgmX/PglI C-terminal domain-containing protein [Sandaracinaceae bacterium]|nr:AgmX/PglI C-terminal domain-containing protein [Sandaracinaceae bacterium]
MAHVVSSSQRKLRVALVFGGALHAETTLDVPRPVAIGSGSESTFLVPGIDGALVLLRPAGAGYELDLDPRVGGSVWLGGQRREASDLRGEGQSRVALGPDDFGVVTIGSVAVFFQMVKSAARIGKPLPGWLTSPAVLLSFLLSVFGHICVILLFILAKLEAPPADGLELPTDLIRRFMVTPPPEDILEEDTGGTNTEDPGIHDREEAGGRAHEGEEGRVGREDAQQENMEMQGPGPGGAAAQRVSHLGLLGALRGGEGQTSAIAEALEGPSIGDLIGGLNSSQTVWGRGSGGAGLRGTGSGGGGTGPGTLFGAGNLGTGVGAGRGAGGGQGGGGPGARGRPAREVAVRVETAPPRISGYLSPEQIMRVVRRNQAAIRYCYENEVQRQPNLRGRIEVQWRISLQGTVTTARIASSTMRNARVEGCIVRQVRNWRFDHPDGGEVSVNFPFIFGTGG